MFLSRLQFAFLIAFHFLLPAFTIGLASYIAVLEGLHLWTRRETYLRLSAFWVRIFAVSFGMGVVSGIVMPFQIGTNWSRYAELTAAIVWRCSWFLYFVFAGAGAWSVDAMRHRPAFAAPAR